MTAARFRGAVAAAAFALLGLAGPLAAPAAAQSADAPPVTISLDRREVSVGVGERFVLTSTVSSQAAEPLTGLIAHIDIVGIDPQRYVDPEDWSPERTMFLEPLTSRSSVRTVWEVQAVDSGPLLVWVTASRPGGEGVAISAPLHLMVGEHIDVNAGGVLPVVVGVPAVLCAFLAAMAWRRRRVVTASTATA